MTYLILFLSLFSLPLFADRNSPINYFEELEKARILEAQRQRLLKLVPWTSIRGEVFKLPDFQKDLLLTAHGTCFMLLGGTLKVLQDQEKSQTSIVQYSHPEAPPWSCRSGIKGKVSYRQLQGFRERRLQNILTLHELQNILAFTGESIFSGREPGEEFIPAAGLYEGIKGQILVEMGFPVSPHYSWRTLCSFDGQMKLQKIADFPLEKKSVYVYQGESNLMCEQHAVFIL